MGITGSQPALMQARFGVARFGATRSGVYNFRVRVSINGTDRTTSILLNPKMRIGKTLGDGVATCSFTVDPTAGLTLVAGQEVIVGFGSLDNREFGGQISEVTHIRRPGASQEPYLQVRCTDYRRLFNRLSVTKTWANASATMIAIDIVRDYTSGFGIGGIETGLDHIVSFVAENDTPTDLLRRLAGLMGGGFYIDDNRIVHLFGSAGEGRSPSPQAISNTSEPLVAFTHKRDFSQIRTRVLCEGKRTRLMLALPTGYNYSGSWNFVPIEDATGFAMVNQKVRIGGQRFTVLEMYKTAALPGENPEGTSVRTAAAVGATSLALDSVQFLLDQLQANGGPNPSASVQFVKVGEQVIFFNGYSYSGTPTTSAQLIGIPASGFGSIATPIEVDAAVTPLATLNIYQQRVEEFIPFGADVVLYAQADNASAQSTLAAVEGGDGIHEHVVSESYADYLGAASRAEAELAVFDDTAGILEAEWQTRDLAAQIGCPQSIALTSPDALTATLTITRVDMTIDTPWVRPTKAVSASNVKTARLIDVVQTGKA